MKKLATCAVAITGFIGTPAFAADMGVPAAPPPAPVWNWTGWYAGVNVGASFGRAKTDFGAPVTVTVTDTSVPGGGGKGTSNFGFFGSNTESPDGFMGGGQIGYNWQYSPLIVVGFEADIQGAIEKNSNTLTNNFSGFPDVCNPTHTLCQASPSPGVAGSTALNYATKIDWFGTARVRIGYVWGNGNVMSYLTGGLAYGRVSIDGTSITSGTTPEHGLPSFSFTQAFDHNAVNTGWAAGYGTEGRLGISNWTWKVEGLWMDLGTLDTTAVGASVSSTSGTRTISVTTGPVTTHTRFTDGILRGGLNYKFY